MASRFLGFLARLCCSHPVWVIAAVLLAWAVAFGLAMRLDFSTGVAELLPKEQPQVKQFFEAVSMFSGADTLIAVITSRQPDNVVLMQEFIRLFAESIDDERLITDVDYNAHRVAIRFFKDVFLSHLFLFLDRSDIERVVEILTPEGMRKQLAQARATLISQAGVAEKEFIAADPLGLRELLWKYSPKLKSGFRLQLIDGYYFSNDTKRAFVLIQPKQIAQHLDFDRRLLSFLRKKAEATFAALDRLHHWQSGEAKRRLDIAFTGSHAILLEESQVIRGDLSKALLGSFVLVVALFVVAFGRLGGIVYVGLPLAVAMTFIFALCYLWLGYINVLTIVLVVMNMGLGIDFSVHLYNRYADERSAGLDPTDALAVAYSRTGVGTLACAATTALAFLACSISRFVGLKNLGILAGGGIMLCLATTLLLLGPLLALGEKLPAHFRYRRISGFGLGALGRFVQAHSRLVIAGWIALTALSAIPLARLEFCQDIRSLRAKSSPALSLQSQISREVGGSFRQWMVTFQAQTSESALAQAERLNAVLGSMVKEGLLASCSSLLDYVPPLSRQKENIEILPKLAGRLSGRDLGAEFESALRQTGFKVTPAYRAYIATIAAALRVRAPLDVAKSAANPRLRRILGRFVHVGPDGLHLAAYFSPARLVAKGSDVFDFVSRVSSRLGSEFSIVSTMVLTAVLKRIITGDMWAIAALAAIAVIGVLLVHFRRVSIAMVAMLPLLCSVVIMLGVGSLLGIDLNPINLFVVPMILGIGIDDGIHLVHRFCERRQGVRGAVSSTGKALVLTSLTTILAFGTLVTAGFAGLAQLGVLTILGVSSALLASIVLLPALLFYFRRQDYD